MDYAEMRDLVRLRYELRSLLAERPGDIDAGMARSLIARIGTLVAADAEEAAAVDRAAAGR